MTFAATLFLLTLAADSRIGAAANSTATAVVIGPVVIAGTQGVPLSPHLLDVVSARVIKEHGVDRGSLLLNIPVSEKGDVRLVDQIVEVIDEAYRDVQPGRVAIESGGLVVNGRTVLHLCGVQSTQPIRDADAVRGRYRVLELPPPDPDPLSLPHRIHRRYSVQTLSFGTNLIIIALASEPPSTFADQLARQFPSRHVIVTGCRNDLSPTSWSVEDQKLILSAVRVRR